MHEMERAKDTVRSPSRDIQYDMRLEKFLGNSPHERSLEPPDAVYGAMNETFYHISRGLSSVRLSVGSVFDLASTKLAELPALNAGERDSFLLHQGMSLMHSVTAIPLFPQLRSKERFQYAPLDRSARSIRLIRIHPGLAPSGQIRCSIQHTLIDVLPYCCVSYEWGTDQGGERILMDDKFIDVRANLLAFLSEAASAHHSTDPWIDALCIDQDSPLERNHQVRQMGAIYANAQQVMVWLGTDGRTASILSGLSSTEARRSREYEDMKYLSQNSYWKRAWITQKISLARSVLLMGKGADINTQYLQYSARSRLARQCGMRQREPQKENLLALLHEYRSQKCYNRRDIMYSLLSLCQDGRRVNVDYTTSVTDVVRSVMMACKSHLCICSGSTIASALHQPAIVDNQFPGILIYHAKYNHYSGGLNSRLCPDCGWNIYPHPLPPGQFVCLRRLCPGMLFHIYWYDVEDSRARLCVLNGRSRTKFMSTRARVSNFPEKPSTLQSKFNTCSLRLPISFLFDLGPGVWKSSYPSELDEHLKNEKGFTRLHRASEENPPGPMI